jgi:hypothetical protein
MGLRRLRNRLDQLQGRGNEVADAVQDLVADIQEGVEVKVVVNVALLRTLMTGFWQGKGPETFELPITLKIVP